ncbi:MAG: hypothetical protein NTY77_08725 [Elusimicrobia bacterium]|nr:hypothetical protein [Elusimicrobiota bacterium]
MDSAFLALLRFSTKAAAWAKGEVWAWSGAASSGAKNSGTSFSIKGVK